MSGARYARTDDDEEELSESGGGKSQDAESSSLLTGEGAAQIQFRQVGRCEKDENRDEIYAPDNESPTTSCTLRTSFSTAHHDLSTDEDDDDDVNTHLTGSKYLHETVSVYGKIYMW